MASSLVTLAWHHDNFTGGPVLLYAAAAVQVLGGIAIQFRRTAKTGAAALCAVYLVFALLCVPRIVAAPQMYGPWGNFFEPFSLATGAAMVYARLRIGRILFGVCAVSFTLEQAFYLHATASLVPAWLPPGQLFWAVATTVFFALAAVALLTNRMALLAARLLTMMIVLFGLLVWVPMLLSNPHKHSNWSEFALTIAIAGAAWILADRLGEYPA